MVTPIIIIITDLYSAFRSEDIEALRKANENELEAVIDEQQRLGLMKIN